MNGLTFEWRRQDPEPEGWWTGRSLIDITCRFCYSCPNLAIGFNISGCENPAIDIIEGVFSGEEKNTERYETHGEVAPG
jgi:hypothetical protein